MNTHVTCYLASSRLLSLSMSLNCCESEREFLLTKPGAVCSVWRERYVSGCPLLQLERAWLEATGSLLLWLVLVFDCQTSWIWNENGIMSFFWSHCGGTELDNVPQKDGSGEMAWWPTALNWSCRKPKFSQFPESVWSQLPITSVPEALTPLFWQL